MLHNPDVLRTTMRTLTPLLVLLLSPALKTSARGPIKELF